MKSTQVGYGELLDTKLRVIAESNPTESKEVVPATSAVTPRVEIQVAEILKSDHSAETALMSPLRLPSKNK